MKIHKVKIERIVSERKTGTLKDGVPIRIYGVDQIKKGYVLKRKNTYFSILEFKKYYVISETSNTKIVADKKHKQYKYLLRDMNKDFNYDNIEVEENKELKLVKKA